MSNLINTNEPIDFKGKLSKDGQSINKHYRYDFRRLTNKQVAIALEIGEFKAAQIYSEPSTVTELLRSEAPGYAEIIMSYLVREVKEGVLQPYDDSKQQEIQKFFDDMEQFDGDEPIDGEISSADMIGECLQDFFTRKGRSGTYSTILLGRRSRKQMELYSALAMKQEKQSKSKKIT